MDLTQKLKPLSEYADPIELRQLLAPILEYLEEELKVIIPSFVMRQDGPSLNTLFLVTGRYLAECPIGQDTLHFDVIDINTVFNIRLRVHEAKVGSGDSDVGEKTYPAATLELLHAYHDFSSTITYFGSKREKWLKQVLKAFPARLVLGPSG